MGTADDGELVQVGTSPSSTLADILFSDRGALCVHESEWIALVRSIAAADKQALRALYERTHKIIFTLVMRITHSRQTAEELTVDVFHDVWRRAGTYDPAHGSVIGWMLNQARSRAIDRVRFEQRKKRSEPPDATAVDLVVGGPDEALELQQRARGLRQALATLTPDELQALEMAFFAGLTHAETAAQLQQPLGTVKTRIRSGLEKLRQALSDGSES